MRISNLSNKSGNPSSSDYLVLDDGTTVTKIDYNKLAKAIIENYASSTLAGSAQSVKSALDTLNSKMHSFSIPANKTATITLSKYATAFQLFTATSTTKYMLLFSNGYINEVMPDSRITATISADYKTVTITSTSTLYFAFLHVGNAQVTINVQ